MKERSIARLPRLRRRRILLPLLVAVLILTGQPAVAGGLTLAAQLRSPGALPLRTESSNSVNTNFAAGLPGPWPVGNLPLNGATAALAHGYYVLTNQNGYAAMSFPKAGGSFAAGTVSATFHLPTAGKVGVVARYTFAGNVLNYTDCWLDASSRVGCDVWVNGAPITLLAPRAMSLAGKLNHTLALSLQGATFTVAVDGRQVYQGQASHLLPAGQWGLYVIGKFSEGVVKGLFSRASIAPAGTTPILTPTPTRTAVPTTTKTPTAMPTQSRTAASIWAWGADAEGELGDGKHTRSTIPVQTLNLHDVRAISSRYGYALAVLQAGTVWAWGINDSGQLGSGTSTYSSTPIQVMGLTHITAVAAGAGHSLALRNDGTVWAWGSNTDGELGSGTTGSGSRSPSEVKGLQNIEAIAAGDGFSLALERNGVVWSWGTNANGELGNGTTVGSSTPSQVKGLSNVQSIAAGLSHSLAVKDDGTLWAWGANTDGQLGNGGTAASSTPIEVQGLGGVQTTAVGDAFSLAVKIDGTVWVWGAGDSGELGTGRSMSTSVPIQVKSLTGIQAVAAGDAFGLALGRDGTVWSWGANSSGQLGNGSTSGSSTPRQILGLTNVRAVAAGSLYGLALVK